MKQETKIAIGIGAVIAGFYLLKFRAVGNLVFFPGGITGFSLENAAPVLRFSLIVQNTNSVAINLQSLAGNAFTNDGGSSTLIGNVSIAQPVHVPGNGQTVVELSIRMRLISVVNQLIAAYQNSNIQKTIEVQAFGNVDGLQVPINFLMTVGA